MNINHKAKVMIEANHYRSDEIVEEAKKVSQLWEELNEIAKARKEVRKIDLKFFLFFHSTKKSIYFIPSKSLQILSKK